MTAACADYVAAGMDPWFAGGIVADEIAAGICAGCSTRASCLSGAIERGEKAGVWGGSVFDEAAAPFALIEPTPARIRQRVRGLADHGHRSRYVAGCRCAPCTAANTRYVASRPRKPVVTRGEIVDVDPPLTLWGIA